MCVCVASDDINTSAQICIRDYFANEYIMASIMCILCGSYHAPNCCMCVANLGIQMSGMGNNGNSRNKNSANNFKDPPNGFNSPVNCVCVRHGYICTTTTIITQTKSCVWSACDAHLMHGCTRVLHAHCLCFELHNMCIELYASSHGAHTARYNPFKHTGRGLAHEIARVW